MTRKTKYFVAIATCAAIAMSSIAGVEAASIRPAPDRGDNFCYAGGPAAKTLQSVTRAAGYIKVYNSPQPVNGPVKTFFGVKSGDRWFALAFDTCKYKIVSEGRLKSGKPAFIDGMINIGG